MEFSRQESWSGLPFPPSTDLPNPGIKPGCPALQEDSLSSEPPRKPRGGWLFLAWSLPWVSRKNRIVTQGSPSTFPMVAFLIAQLAKSACNTGDLGLIPGSGKSLEKEMATHSRILCRGQRSLVDYKHSPVTRVGHKLVTKPSLLNSYGYFLLMLCLDH